MALFFKDNSASGLERSTAQGLSDILFIINKCIISAEKMPKKGKKPDWGARPDVGPKPNQDVCISEEVKIGINLAVERFRLNETQKGCNNSSHLTT